MKGYRLLTLGLVLVVLSLILFGCGESQQEKIKKEEDLRSKTERLDRLSKRIEELNTEIERLEKTVDSLNEVIFKMKISLVALKDSQQEIKKTADNLRAQIIPPQTVPEKKTHHWILTLIIIIIVVVAIFYLFKLMRAKREIEEEEIPLEEGTPFDTKSSLKRRKISPMRRNRNKRKNPFR